MDVGWLDRFKKKFSSFSYREPLSSGFWAGIKVGFICLLFMFFVWISLIYLPVYVPEVYNFFWGEQVRQAHLAEVVGDENNATVSIGALWMLEVILFCLLRQIRRLGLFILGWATVVKNHGILLR